MRKLASFLLTVTLSCMMLASCASKPTSEDLTPTTEPSSLSAFEGPVNDILDRIINDTIAKNILVDEELKGITCYEKSVDPDSCQDILGLTPAEFTSDIEAALEAKPDGSWFAHSMPVSKSSCCSYCYRQLSTIPAHSTLSTIAPSQD